MAITYQTIRAAALNCGYTGNVDSFIHKYEKRGLISNDKNDLAIYHVSKDYRLNKDAESVDKKIVNRELLEHIYKTYTRYRLTPVESIDHIAGWLDGWKREIEMCGIDTDEFYAWAEARFKTEGGVTDERVENQRREDKVDRKRREIESERKLAGAYRGI